MEAALVKKSGGGHAIKEEKRDESRIDAESCGEDIVIKDKELDSAKAEMGEVREENQRLRMYLNRLMKDYEELQIQFYDIVRQETESTNTSHSHHQEVITEESGFVSLSLGRTSSDPRKHEKPAGKGKEDQEDDKEGLDLGLFRSSFEMSKTEPTGNSQKASPEKSLEGNKEDGGSWGPRKVVKTGRSEDEEVLQQNPVKKARVSVRVRCDTPTMNDGCQWRKYGQKIAKGNPCPRAYYRCTVAPSCPVRKQVQRCAGDMSILITTYEGIHNHPLPISATSMAATTSAAASMLLSGSSSSEAGGPSSLQGPTTSTTGFPGLNFYLSDHNSKPNQFYLPNPLISSTSCPTITLDLTSSSSSSTFSTPHVNKMISSNFLSAPRYSSTNLNFGSLESNPQPMSCSNGVLNYGTQVGSLKFGRQPQENHYNSFLQKSLNPNPPQQSLPEDTIVAATKVITSDPSFQSALAAALTSIIGTSGDSGGSSGCDEGRGSLGRQIEGDKFGQNFKPSETFPFVSNFPSTTVKGNKCSSNYLNRSPSVMNAQPGSMMFLQPPLPFSTTKSKSSSPGDRDHIN